MFSDWRLSFSNLQTRDRYFSQLKALIDHNLEHQGRKTVLASHSMGALIVLYFFKWVESPDHGNGGPDWCEQHIAGWANIAGTLLGVPKAMAACVSRGRRSQLIAPVCCRARCETPVRRLAPCDR